MRALLLRRLFGTAKCVGSKVTDYAQYRPSALSMQHLIDFGRKGEQRTSFDFLKKELLVRLANIMKEMDLLPAHLLESPSTKLIYNWYLESFTDLLEYEKAVFDDQTGLNFTQELGNVFSRHSTVVETMAEGLMEMKSAHGIDPVTQKNIQFFLDRFYLSRISIRMLISQHIILFGQSTHPFYQVSQHIGCIDPVCDVVGIVEDAYENAKFLCDRYYLASPDLKLECTNQCHPSQPITLVYVPSHLYHIMIELFKNALRAVTEYHKDSDSLPEVNVLVVKGKEDLSIKISDKGGGVPRRIVGDLFNYMYTTASLPSPELSESSAPMAGLGYGLPLSRLYARYFHGDLFLVSFEGYGTDALVYLKALAIDASELLPMFNAHSKHMYKSSEKNSHWVHSRT